MLEYYRVEYKVLATDVEQNPGCMSSFFIFIRRSMDLISCFNILLQLISVTVTFNLILDFDIGLLWISAVISPERFVPALFFFSPQFTSL